jgi:hypothetical protein
MLRIEERSWFDLPVDKIFDAERDISLHSSTQSHRGEKAVGGCRDGPDRGGPGGRMGGGSFRDQAKVPGMDNAYAESDLFQG